MLFKCKLDLSTLTVESYFQRKMYHRLDAEVLKNLTQTSQLKVIQIVMVVMNTTKVFLMTELLQLKKL
jgi:hypothetical protein